MPARVFPTCSSRTWTAADFPTAWLNLGVSGDTTQDGLARVPMALAEKPAIVLLELGGNDGLRGIPLSITQANLAQMIEAFQARGRARRPGRNVAAAELRP